MRAAAYTSVPSASFMSCGRSLLFSIRCTRTASSSTKSSSTSYACGGTQPLACAGAGTSTETFRSGHATNGGGTPPLACRCAGTGPETPRSGCASNGVPRLARARHLQHKVLADDRLNADPRVLLLVRAQQVGDLLAHLLELRAPCKSAAAAQLLAARRSTRSQLVRQMQGHG